ncbi:hypothetical protein HELRODRAFT_168795 [Helobdella robusta]|uniref:Uncharacterized protein n=1 Tax=Helobdella robusta TaxID=6412 RepID=T1F0Z4_HELRO|nr:hypothetical protein HELRODRAFT_168795 [Helobdella robusta]ESO08877.1 hypothetical protein HELRODRAFT_168795 [Helobdella robusta]
MSRYEVKMMMQHIVDDDIINAGVSSLSTKLAIRLGSLYHVHYVVFFGNRTTESPVEKFDFYIGCYRNLFRSVLIGLVSNINECQKRCLEISFKFSATGDDGCRCVNLFFGKVRSALCTGPYVDPNFGVFVGRAGTYAIYRVERKLVPNFVCKCAPIGERISPIADFFTREPGACLSACRSHSTFFLTLTFKTHRPMNHHTLVTRLRGHVCGDGLARFAIKEVKGSNIKKINFSLPPLQVA